MIEKEELLTIIPHRNRMLMLDNVKCYNLGEKSIEAEYRITSDCLFYDSQADGVPAWAGFEFIAQAISAYTGIDYREKGKPPRIGFILGISRMNIAVPFFKNGTVLTVKAKEVERMDSFFIYEGEIFEQNAAEFSGQGQELTENKVLEGKLTVIDVDDETAMSMKEEK
ncbi:MAG: 3-hydroxylacyl-ACP dehydratase [Treponema sp.]|jgi:predicted hotdog family 3-hydroxylacyl-ACP dehydratase|nr:3-hydroxylacyl-ACP dehydratase [Treponema sp.]